MKAATVLGRNCGQFWVESLWVGCPCLYTPFHVCMPLVGTSSFLHTCMYI